MTDTPSGEMSYTRLGDSGLVVSRLAFGTMTFTLGSDFLPGVASVGQREATEMVARALDGGINFFDAADGYSAGDAETALGEALRGRRQEAVICTKIGFRQGPSLLDAGLSRRALLAGVKGCLRRLGTDWIDLLVVHKTDFSTPMEETLRALDTVVEHGHARYIGFSNWPAWQAARAIEFQRAHGLAAFKTGQLLYNPVTRDIERDLVPMMAAMGVSLMAWSPLAQGLLSGKYDPANIGEEGRLASFDLLRIDPAVAGAALSALGEIAQARGASLPQVALAWILAKARTHTAIVGASRLSHLEDALGAAALALSPEEVARVDAAAPPPRLYPEWFDAQMTDEALARALA